MKFFKKLLSVVLSMTMLLSFASTTVFAAETSDDEVVAYLVEAGYPMDVIEKLDEETRIRFYDGQYTYQSSNTTYGIFTEEYRVEYTIDESGRISIDNDNLQILESLLEDTAVVEKILIDKANADESTTAMVSTNAIEPRATFEIDAIESAISAGEQPIELLSLSNWSATMVCSHDSYEDGVARKNLTYTWTWEYDPMWVLTDKVAMAWSGGFTAEPETIYWSYTKRVGYTGALGVYTNSTDNGYGYDDYNPGAGVAKAIDITDPLAGTYIVHHTGTLSADITKTTDVNSRESCVGRYYHMRILPGISLSFSSTGPSISVSSSSGSYDQSSDSADAFWAMTDD